MIKAELTIIVNNKPHKTTLIISDGMEKVLSKDQVRRQLEDSLKLLLDKTPIK